MSVKVMTWVWEHSPVAGNERLVLLAVADSADDGRNAWPSVATLARKTRLDPRTVQRVVRRLRDGGHLAVATAAGRGGANVYAVLMNGPREVVDESVENLGDKASTPWQPAAPGKLPPRHQRHPPPGTSARGPPAQLCHPNVLTSVRPPPTRPCACTGRRRQPEEERIVT
jgi:hypothetical protein